MGTIPSYLPQKVLPPRRALLHFPCRLPILPTPAMTIDLRLLNQSLSMIPYPNEGSSNIIFAPQMPFVLTISLLFCICVFLPSSLFLLLLGAGLSCHCLLLVVFIRYMSIVLPDY